ncbi:type IV secretory system conjugative DNA transfer family protein [Pseudomonas proteolytica]|uniref:type IV secretory system conjugative DNA transfer family protein n=1 Tax=Pseudomonas proteolytica TaxID=219574 RepID=UPI001473527E|nr:type IV secretory system conjugative DNA transfer family protein [Pseudomonas proteolytica]NMZ14951.1 type IV secretory system conjugative DNA transfer family protein [Pseudomonas proteolytica]
MKRIAIAIILAQATWQSYAVADAQSMSTDPRLGSGGSALSLDSLMNPTSEASTGVNSLRAQLLADGGRTVGFRGGLVARAQDLIGGLRLRERALDVQYEFGSLVSPSGMLPPVIVESRDVAAFTPDQIRTANRVYKKERDERFVSVPPTWRDYLLVGLPTQTNIDLPVMEARPVDSAEMKIWQEAVKQGWHEGADQALAILDANFNRLTRDYKGMLLYSTLLQQGMVGQSQVAESQQTVTGDGGQLTLGDKMRRLVGKAEFQIDAAQWRPTIKVGALPPAAPVPAKASVAAPAQSAVSTAVPPAQKIIVADTSSKIASATAAAPVTSASTTAAAMPTTARAPIDVTPVRSTPPVASSTSSPVRTAVQSVTGQAKPAPAVPVNTTVLPTSNKPVSVVAATPAKSANTPLPVWEAKDGSTLRATVEQWAKTAGWTIEWVPDDLDYEVPYLRIEGSLEEAVLKIFSYYQNAERPLLPKGSRQQKFIRVIEVTNSNNPRKSA